MLTVLEIIAKTTEFFAGRGIESPRLQAELLVGHALGLKRMQLYLQFERPLTEPELETLRPLVRRRAKREPLQYIVGETEFCDLKLKVDSRALIPRPETELLVEILAEKTKDQPPARVLDLGTGTGAIALALAQQFSSAAVIAIDASDDALALARENAERTGLASRVTLVKSDWFSALGPESAFDLIVSNPPYLTAQEVAEATPEVREFEPSRALVADEAGMADLKTILRGAHARLALGGLLALETGIAQHAELTRFATELGYARIESHRDLTGRDRFVLAWK